MAHTQMEKYEHSWDELPNWISIVKHHEIMTKRSNEGWELVIVIMVNVLDEDRMRFYWKRRTIFQ